MPRRGRLFFAVPEFARLEQLEKEVADLRVALQSRIVIEQAKGVLCAVLDVDPDKAFEVLRRHTRSNRRPIHELAREVIESRGGVIKTLEEEAVDSSRAS